MHYILSLGGSLIAPPGGIDSKFLKQFRQLILKEVKAGHKFFIITGGGMTCRNYLSAATKVYHLSASDGDWLGIHATRLNGHLLRTILADIAHSEIITNPLKKIKASRPVVIAAGYKPGWSTDYVAILLAREYKVKTVVNLSNIAYVYTKDPRKFKDAKLIKEIKWADFRKIVGNRWSPGLNAPFDPIASRLAADLKLKVIILNKKKINNLQKCLEAKRFVGTIIA
ncbi:MAG: UMP kinase [Candidatus Falkowbacteria bacterium]|nr:UMP kinase [Candidatus Falkowbacteria bacterium]